jgi:predicted secreted protein
MIRRHIWRTALAVPIVAMLGSAHAGEGSALNVIGFSPDGRYFAFEQYGTQSGSGAVYASITANEVAGDRLVKGMPISASLASQGTSGVPTAKLLAEVRAQVALQAAPLLRQFAISEPGRPVARQPESRAREMLDSEQVKGVREAALRKLALPAEIYGPDTWLVLTEFDVALPRCKLVSQGHPNGFGLTLERKARPTIHLRRDQTIPAVRGCPDRYGISEVHALPLADNAIALAVIVQFFRPGSGGPERRYLAVTGRIS